MAPGLGRITEMRTGEGKTLTATMPAYLHALTGRGVHVMTANDYLAERDAEWMGPPYRRSWPATFRRADRRARAR